MNEQNLRPINLSHEEATKNGRKGGLRSGEVRQEKKKQQQAILEMLNADFGGKSVFERMIGGLTKRVIEQGDQAAFEKLMEYAGTSVRLELLQEDRKLKREELKIKREQLEAGKPEAGSDAEAAEAWASVLHQIRNASGENDESSTES